jgi:hypothetical protein
MGRNRGSGSEVSPIHNRVMSLLRIGLAIKTSNLPLSNSPPITDVRRIIFFPLRVHCHCLCSLCIGSRKNVSTMAHPFLLRYFKRRSTIPFLRLWKLLFEVFVNRDFRFMDLKSPSKIVIKFYKENQYILTLSLINENVDQLKMICFSLSTSEE